MKVSDKRAIVRGCDKLALQIGFRFNLSDSDKNEISELLINSITSKLNGSIDSDDKIISRAIQKKSNMQNEKRKAGRPPGAKNFLKFDQPEEQEMEKLRIEVAEIKKADFPGRIYSNDSIAKMNRLEQLEKIFNKA
jgi:hypothetical protein